MPTMLRPTMTVLPDTALVSEPEKALVDRPTHRLAIRQAYHLGPATESNADAEPDGYLSEGASVKLLQHGDGRLCQVQDELGRCLITAFSGLRALG